jgi:AcrR family transcriptional regulator
MAMGDSEGSVQPPNEQPSSRRLSKEHRRRELVDAAMRAIRRSDRSLSMNDLAAEAEITKPILYRHFGDRQGLVNAISLELLSILVGESPERLQTLSQAENQSILELKVPTPDATPEGLRAFLRAVVDAFIEGAEREPELFRFVMREDGFRTLHSELSPV